MELWNARYLSKVTKNNVPVYPTGTGAILYNKDVLKLNQYLAPQKSRTLGQTWPIESTDKKRFVTHEQVLGQQQLDGKINYPYKSANLYDVIPPDVYRVNLVGNPSFYGGLSQPVAHRNTGILDLEDSDFINWKEQTDASLAGQQSNTAYLSNALHAPPMSGLDRKSKTILDTNVQFFSRPIQSRQLLARTNKGEIRYLNLPEYPNSSQYEQIRSDAKAKQDEEMKRKIVEKRQIEAEHYNLGPAAFAAKYGGPLDKILEEKNALVFDPEKRPAAARPVMTPSTKWVEGKEIIEKATRMAPKPLGGMDDAEDSGSEGFESADDEPMDDERDILDRNITKDVGEMVNATLSVLPFQKVGRSLLDAVFSVGNKAMWAVGEEYKFQKGLYEGSEMPNLMGGVASIASKVGNIAYATGSSFNQEFAQQQQDLFGSSPNAVQPGPPTPSQPNIQGLPPSYGTAQFGGAFYSESSALPTALSLNDFRGQETSISKLSKVLATRPRGALWVRNFIRESRYGLEDAMAEAMATAKAQIDSSRAITTQEKMIQLNLFLDKQMPTLLETVKQGMYNEMDSGILNDPNEGAPSMTNREVLEVQYREIAPHLENAMKRLFQNMVLLPNFSSRSSKVQQTSSALGSENPVLSTNNSVTNEQNDMNTGNLSSSPGQLTSNNNNDGVNGVNNGFNEGSMSRPQGADLGVDDETLNPSATEEVDFSTLQKLPRAEQNVALNRMFNLDNILFEDIKSISDKEFTYMQTLLASNQRLSVSQMKFLQRMARKRETPNYISPDRTSKNTRSKTSGVQLAQGLTTPKRVVRLKRREDVTKEELSSNLIKRKENPVVVTPEEASRPKALKTPSLGVKEYEEIRLDDFSSFTSPVSALHTRDFTSGKKVVKRKGRRPGGKNVFLVPTGFGNQLAVR
jgi:hypothetical protein